MALPVWRQLRTELHPQGLEIVTVALDLEVDAARSWIERSGAEHPQLVDTAHKLDELLGVVNVPSALWVDENGMIVRPPHTAAVERYDFSKLKAPEGLPDDLDAHIRDMLEQVKRIPRFDADHYVEALRDWVERGAASEYALSPDEVVRRSAARPPAVAEAAAEFELGQYLHHAGQVDDARAHFRAAHRLQPDNWTYKRNAWELVSPGIQGPTDFYDGDWLSDIKATGPERYYARPDF
jgi:tetratricopeptide (TPR) repeat protein